MGVNDQIVDALPAIWGLKDAFLGGAAICGFIGSPGIHGDIDYIMVSRVDDKIVDVLCWQPQAYSIPAPAAVGALVKPAFTCGKIERRRCDGVNDKL